MFVTKQDIQEERVNRAMALNHAIADAHSAMTRVLIEAGRMEQFEKQVQLYEDKESET